MNSFDELAYRRQSIALRKAMLEAHTKWLMFMNADPDDTGCPQSPTEVFLEAFEDGFDAGVRFAHEQAETK